MKRRPRDLCDGTFDVLVVGAGIHGACIAREVALRGLSVAVVDRSDFGGATSANSQKIIHGGLRYLQKMDLRRVRESVRERAVLMRLAPHLIHPLPFVIPTGGYGLRSRMGMSAAFGLCNLVAPGDPVPPDRRAEEFAKRILSRDEFVALFPDLAGDRTITGGALWYDGQVYNTERLTLAFLRSAVELGAVATNYIDVRRLCCEGDRVSGAVAVDGLGGGEFEIRARFVVSATGPWVADLADQADRNKRRGALLWSKAWNIVSPSVHATHALGMTIPAAANRPRGKRRLLFQTPWRERTIIGTMYAPSNLMRSPSLSPADVADAVEEANRSFPWLGLRTSDVSFDHVGLLPVSSRGTQSGEVIDRLSDRPLVWDHEHRGGLPGVVSVCGVKYTTARLVAEEVAKLVSARLEHSALPTESNESPVDGGDLSSFDTHVARLRSEAAPAWGSSVARLARHYGSRARELLDYGHLDAEDMHPVAEGAEATRAEVKYAVREEMAVRLADVVFRRTGLGTVGYPGEAALRGCAKIMAGELGWSGKRTEEEIVEVSSRFIMADGCTAAQAFEPDAASVRSCDTPPGAGTE